MATPRLPPEVLIAIPPSLPLGSAWAEGRPEALTATDSAAPTRARLVTATVKAATMTTCPWCGCRRHPAPSAWMRPSVQQSASHRNACAVLHPLLCTVPASAPPRSPLPGRFWDLVLARVTVPQPPAARPPAQALRVQARWIVGGAQTPRPQRVQKGWVVLTCGAGPGPQL